MNSLDHLGIAVKSLAKARKFYESLGMKVLNEEVVEHEQVRVGMVPVGETRIELRSLHAGGRAGEEKRLAAGGQWPVLIVCSYEFTRPSGHRGEIAGQGAQVL